MFEIRSLPFAAVVLLTALAVPNLAVAQESDKPKSFPEIKARFEQNATDKDVEVVFEIGGRSEGLTMLSVEAPDGRLVVDFASDESGAGASGIRQFVFESPEPKDVASLKAGFPEGAYSFEGETQSGLQLRGKATLSHKLPATTKFMFPQAKARNVPFESPKIAWAPVPGVAAYMIELEQEDLGVSITARLPASDTAFVVPLGFLKASTEYMLGIGTVSMDGNVSFIETSFTTAAAK